METKPFSIQAPESIAKEYGGNKQKIAEASQMGLVDPTAAVLAGMFIDRMRAAQMQEQAPPQTIAQQVFAPPAPQAPPSAPPPPPMGGPGGPPPMPGGPGMPPPPQMNAPQGMAGGGLASLPVPDAMFDEPVDAQSFGGGGIVSFAPGGTVYTVGDQYYDTSGHKIARPTGPGYKVVEAEYALTPEGTTLRPKRGAETYSLGQTNPVSTERLSAADFAAAMFKPGEGYSHTPYTAPAAPTAAAAAAAAAPATPSVAPAPGGGPRPTSGLASTPVGQAMLPAGTAPSTAPPASSEYQKVVDRLMLPKDREEAAAQEEALYKRTLGAQPERDRTLQEARSAVSPEGQAKEKKQDMWMALAHIGFGMAGTQSPNFLQALGQAANAALPGMQDSAKERRANQREALKTLADAEGMDRSEKRYFMEKGLSRFDEGQRLLTEASRYDHMDQWERAKYDEQVRQFNARMTFEGQQNAADRANRAATAGGGGGLTEKNRMDMRNDVVNKLAAENGRRWNDMTPAAQQVLIDARLAQIGMPGAAGGNFGAPPPGAVQKR